MHSVFYYIVKETDNTLVYKPYLLEPQYLH